MKLQDFLGPGPGGAGSGGLVCQVNEINKNLEPSTDNTVRNAIHEMQSIHKVQSIHVTIQ